MQEVTGDMVVHLQYSGVTSAGRDRPLSPDLLATAWSYLQSCRAHCPAHYVLYVLFVHYVLTMVVSSAVCSLSSTAP